MKILLTLGLIFNVNLLFSQAPELCGKKVSEDLLMKAGVLFDKHQMVDLL
jgi:hypothetical protein